MRIVLVLGLMLTLTGAAFAADPDLGTKISKSRGAVATGSATSVSKSAPSDCSLPCSGSPEGEPTLSDGYVDLQNGGCNSALWGYPFQDLTGDADGASILCAQSGWYDSASRDTDWFIAIFGESGVIEWTLDAEQWIQGRALSPLDCDRATSLQVIQAGPCSPATMTVTGTPGDLAWFWVAPVAFVPPSGFAGHDFRYTSEFLGLQAESVAVQETSWGRVKSMYH